MAIGIINNLLGLKLGTFAPQKLIELLEKEKCRIGEEKIAEIQSLVADNRDWIEEVNEMRIQITHLSTLKNFGCFVILPYRDGDEFSIGYPTMPDGTRATNLY